MKTSATGDDAPGNASLMRICPIIFTEKLIDNALINAMSTRYLTLLFFAYKLTFILI